MADGAGGVDDGVGGVTLMECSPEDGMRHHVGAAWRGCEMDDASTPS